METSYTSKSISSVLDKSLCSKSTYDAYIAKLQFGLPTRDEDPEAHFCVYFVPYNADTKEIFIIHHKKSNKWIPPGGHIDKDEILFETLNREIFEELGIKKFFTDEPKPFYFTVKYIETAGQSCKTHYDIWFLMPTDGKDFYIDERESYAIKWIDIDGAIAMMQDGPDIEALSFLRDSLGNS